MEGEHAGREDTEYGGTAVDTEAVGMEDEEMPEVGEDGDGSKGEDEEGSETMDTTE